ncbi:hypothetical protein Aab01nite_08110 [Paractinoplanes abujensis]|uniref:Uncharacterized protein n=1 Tax=Paractinoplanes abujensis TaxID=882441 RepID=A0A7W7CMM0_9ACTN|nr:hypothetical protein [Actinoplanes abujensis]MBB4691365.1 hypothetical protein [Actinoplanes abujensis]GID17221.1 hypothetical protein Aab01nite_08110 [Actinoplanes abujensis]
MTAPYRWDLVTPDQLGSLLGGTRRPALFFLDQLVECAGTVLARSGGGDLVFVGRSLDSMFDLLGGALDGGLHRLPLSFRRGRRRLTHAETAAARELLAAAGVTPRRLARRDRPITFVDVVHEGSTFTQLYELLRDWVDEEREPWPVIRRKLRFVGVTAERKPSPNAYRWQQDVTWPRELPSRSVLNVSLSRTVWHYFGDVQVKLTRTFRPEQWLSEPDGPRHDEETRQALAEAVALVAYGRNKQGRQALARARNAARP